MVEIAEEVTAIDHDAHAAQLERVRDKINERGITRVAVVGPEGSSGEKLARELGIDAVEHHDNYPKLLAALAQRGVPVLFPVLTVEGEQIPHDETSGDTNAQAWYKSGKASIASMQNTLDEPPTITKLLIAND